MNAPTTNDPVELAMEAEATGAPPNTLAAEVLKGQSALFRWQIANERAGFLLRVLLAIGGVALALALAVMAWQASRADGLVVEAFSVPPDLAAQGLTGPVVASQVLDRFNALQSQSHSIRPRKGAANAWSDTAKLEIPRTGVSIDELQRALRGWLGHERRVSGEVFRTPEGVRLTVRIAGEADTVAAGAGGYAQLFQDGAEHLYRRVDPTRYSILLSMRGDAAGAAAINRQYVNSPDPDERAYALNGLANNIPSCAEALPMMLEAARISRAVSGPAFASASQCAGVLGRFEQQLSLQRRSIAGLQAIRGNPEQPLIARSMESATAVSLGDAALAWTAWMDGPNTRPMYATRAHLVRATHQLRLHDVARARAALGEGAARGPQVEAAVAAAAGDWAAVAAVLQAFQTSDAPPIRAAEAFAPFRGRGLLAEALARLGRFDEARAAIAPTPLDCYPCVIARGTVEALAGRAAEADRWFAEAVRIGPSLPQAEEAWARALLARGDAAGAIGKAQASAKKSPRFADVHEVWGEALLARGDAKGAATKLAEAVRLTPAWTLARAKLAEARARVR